MAGSTKKEKRRRMPVSAAVKTDRTDCANFEKKNRENIFQTKQRMTSTLKTKTMNLKDKIKILTPKVE